MKDPLDLIRPRLFEQTYMENPPPVNRSELDLELKSWDADHPQLNTPHWQCTGAATQRGVPLVRVETKLTPVIRVLMAALIGQPLHKTWRCRRLCKEQTCVRPGHFHLEAIYTPRGGVPEPLPAMAFSIPVSDPEEADSDDFEDLCDMILMIDGRRTDPAVILSTRPDWPYSQAEIAKAQAYLISEGL